MNSLQALKDYHFPPPIGFWPPAPGWWAVTVLLLIALYFIIRHFNKRRRGRAVKKAALSELIQLQADYTPCTDTNATYIAALSKLLKRCCMVFYPQAQTSSLYDRAWLHFLNKTGSTQAFTQTPGNLLGNRHYQALNEEDINPLFDLVARWIKHQESLIRAKDWDASSNDFNFIRKGK